MRRLARRYGFLELLSSSDRIVSQSRQIAYEAGQELLERLRSDEGREDLPWTAYLSRKDPLDRVTLGLRSFLVDDYHFRPATVDHVLRRVISDDRAAAGEARRRNLSVLEHDRPIALAALVRAQLIEVDVPRTHELTAAVFEKKPLRPPVGRFQACLRDFLLPT